MTITETVKALYRIWKRPGRAEYKFVIYCGSEPVAQFKSEGQAKVAMAALVQDHLLGVYKEIQKTHD